MGDRKFALVFLGIFLLVLVIFLVLFSVFGSGQENGESRRVLWSALTILVLLFGIIGISLFINRNRR
ncbi:hypothetical protein J4233_03440 [Candidatus Pacearchaeota archaeon]|nr:hypothetical protein [Candidatus Pacearchaeota archaeon]